MNKELFENATKFVSISEMNPMEFKEKIKSFLTDINKANDLKENESAERLIIETCHKYYNKNTILEIYNAFDLYFLGEFDEVFGNKFKKLYSVTLDFFIKVMNAYNNAKRKYLQLEKPEIKSQFTRDQIHNIYKQFIFQMIEFIDYENRDYVVYFNSNWMVKLFFTWGLIKKSEMEGLKKGDLVPVTKGEFKTMSPDGIYSNLVWSKIKYLKESGKTFMDFINSNGRFKVGVSQQDNGDRVYNIEMK